MNPKKLLVISLSLSVLLHIFLGTGLETYGRVWRLIKRPLIIVPRERVFEIVPYEYKDRSASAVSPKNARFLGPRNYIAKEEQLPERSLSSGRFPPIQTFIPPAPSQISPGAAGVEPNAGNTGKSVEGAGAREKLIALPEGKNSGILSAREKTSDAGTGASGDKSKKLFSEGMPSVGKLIPGTQDLITKMPKEESLDFNRGTIKAGKELIVSTKEFKYWSYLDKMKRKIELLWQYPDTARNKGIGGSLKIDFSIARDGKLERLVLVESSGYSFLDTAAVKALRDAAIYPPFPDTWDIEKLNIEGTFIYEIKMVR
jgi:protein TonB